MSNSNNKIPTSFNFILPYDQPSELQLNLDKNNNTTTVNTSCSSITPTNDNIDKLVNTAISKCFNNGNYYSLNPRLFEPKRYYYIHGTMIKLRDNALTTNNATFFQYYRKKLIEYSSVYEILYQHKVVHIRFVIDCFPNKLSDRFDYMMKLGEIERTPLLREWLKNQNLASKEKTINLLSIKKKEIEQCISKLKQDRNTDISDKELADITVMFEEYFSILNSFNRPIDQLLLKDRNYNMKVDEHMDNKTLEHNYNLIKKFSLEDEMIYIFKDLVSVMTARNNLTNTANNISYQELLYNYFGTLERYTISIERKKKIEKEIVLKEKEIKRLETERFQNEKLKRREDNKLKKEERERERELIDERNKEREKEEQKKEKEKNLRKQERQELKESKKRKEREDKIKDKREKKENNQKKQKIQDGAKERKEQEKIAKFEQDKLRMEYLKTELFEKRNKKN